MKKVTHPPRYSANLIGQIAGLPKPEVEHKFHKVRRWRLDFAWPLWKVAIEVNGGIWIKGRHSRGAGQLKDWEKLNHAAADGWLVFQCDPKSVYSFVTLSLVKIAVDKRVVEYQEKCVGKFREVTSICTEE